MDARVQAAQILERALGSRGREVLAEAGLGSDWSVLTAAVPPAHLQTSSPTRLLQRVRDSVATRGQVRAAVVLTQEVLAQCTRDRGAEHPDTLVELAVMGALASRAGQLDRAAVWLDQALRGIRSRVESDDGRLAAVAGHRGAHLVRVGHLAEAESMFKLALRVRRGGSTAAAGRMAAQLAEVKLRQNQVAEALPYLQEAWTAYKGLYGAHDKRTLHRARALATVSVKLGELESAIPVLRDLLAEATRTSDPEGKAFASFELGMALHRSARTREEGFRLVEAAVRFTREAGNPHPDLPRRITAWSELAARRGRAAEAEGLLQEALEAERRLFGDASAEVGARYVQLARFYRDLGRHQEALGWIDPGVSLLRSTMGDDHSATKRGCQLLLEILFEEANAARGRRDRELARELIERARSVGEAVLGPDHTDVRRVKYFSV